MAGRQASAPSPAIFAPDALEQIYAKETFGGPTQSGLAYAFLKNQQGKRETSQDTYLQDLHLANQLNVMLEQQSTEADLQKVQMQQAVEASKEGHSLDIFKGYEHLTTPEGRTRAGANMGLSADLMRAKIAEKQANAAKSGREGGPEIVTTVDDTGGTLRFKTKGAPPSQQLLDDNAKRLQATTKGIRDRNLAQGMDPKEHARLIEAQRKRRQLEGREER